MNFSDMNFLSVGLRKLLKIRHGYNGGGPPAESKEETRPPRPEPPRPE